jgi:hypothetical protein
MVKDIFLDKYNPKRDMQFALTQSIKASLQHNPTYTKDIDDFLKTEFRDYWKVRLQQIGEYFLEVRDLNFYLDQVVLFTAEMNSKFFQVLSPNKENYENGFRIAHSQKSISVYLKHLWCMDVIPAPPSCPLDRIISERAGITLHVSWTKMNKISDVELALNLFQKLATHQNKALCDWELELFY